MAICDKTHYKNEMLKIKKKKKKKKTLKFNADQFYAETPQSTVFYEWNAWVWD